MSTSENPGRFLTYPSVAASIFEVPEPKEISAEFVYNYFLPNERESVNTFVNQENFARKGSKFARQVVLNFTPLSAIIPDIPALSEIELSPSEKVRLLRRNRRKIISETDFGGDTFVAVQLQDSSIANQILSNIEAGLLQKKIDSKAMSPLETVLKYASETTENVDGEALLESVNVDDLNEYVAIDPATGRPFDVQKAGGVSNLTFNMAINEKFAGDISTGVLQTPISPASAEFSKLSKRLSRIQRNSRRSKKSTTIAANDFIGLHEPIQFESIGLDDVFLGGNTVMGYRLRRTRVDSRERPVDTFIENVSATSHIDTRVLYGAEYNYAISVIYLFRFFGYRNNKLVAADVLIESRESPSINVLCEEVVPPRAPEGLSFYMLRNEGLVLEWDYPFNPTDDIKRFQIFRRATINDPFDLIGELDFDDSTIQTPRSENIHDFLKIKVEMPTSYFTDRQFDVDSNFIYAVCSVDAHDLSSPYSEQFQVSFDKFSAQLVVDFVSEKNAPKPYPNFVLRSQLTEDAIRDSRHECLKCYFDPEYLKIIDGERREVDFLQVSDTDVSYKLQLIHLNMQQSVVADIDVK